MHPMAQKTFVQLTDDLDGRPIEDGDGETVAFAYRGLSYEIDLNNKNLEKFDNALSTYIDAARKVSGTGGRRSRAAGRSTPTVGDVDPKAVRAWAEANGVEVSPRGRLKAEVVEQYMASSK